MLRLTVLLLLFVFVSCQKYPGYGKARGKSRGSPALDLLTGGVSEFIVGGRAYGTDLPPLLTGEASFEESRFGRSGDFEGKFERGNSFNAEQGRGISFRSTHRPEIYTGTTIKNAYRRTTNLKNIPWAPRPIPSEPFSPSFSNGNFRSVGDGKWNTLNIGEQPKFPYTSSSFIPRRFSNEGTDFSGIEYPEIRDDQDFKIRRRNSQIRGFGSDIFSKGIKQFPEFPSQGNSFEIKYAADDNQAKFGPRQIFGRNANLPTPVNGIFDNFGIRQSEIIHGDDLVSFGRTRGTNIPVGMDRSFQSIRKIPRAYQSAGSSFSQFGTTGVNDIQPELPRYGFGGTPFEQSESSGLPIVGRVPIAKKY
ncbi:uncharacterized protein LOC134242040 [Saccostrea cucullata]|uniref:uncharacterized protein LOC134242040 n=1 Tax=Saccostrea cuccullata TaxID=36930 RepID=UPI002ED15BB6